MNDKRAHPTYRQFIDEMVLIVAIADLKPDREMGLPTLVAQQEPTPADNNPVTPSRPGGRDGR